MEATSTASVQSINASQASGKRLSRETIAAIVSVIGSLFLLCLAIFVIRKCFIHKRMRKRLTWTSGMPMPVSSDDYMFRNNIAPANIEKPRRVPVPSYVPSEITPAPGSARPSVPPSPNIAAPPISYNNHNATSPLSARSSAQPFSAGLRPKSAHVQYTFIPSLPDELTVSTGETLRVLAEYDDGWGLCVNRMGEQGMVPLECLAYPEPYLWPSDHRNSGRASSLGMR